MAKSPATDTSTKEVKIPNRIFIDADAFMAVVDTANTNHKKAIKVAKILHLRKASAFTSNFAFGEAVTVASQIVGLATAVRMGKDIQKGDYTIIDVTSEQRELALERFSKQASKNTRFTDMVNMVLMDELKIDIIFSFDSHYPKNGYKLLTANTS